MANVEQIRPSNTRSIAATIISGLAVILFGVWLLIGFVGTLPAGLVIGTTWLPALFLMLGMMSLFNGLLRKSGISTYFAAIFLMLALIIGLVNLERTTWDVIWPLFIAIPAVASFFALWQTTVKRFHLKSIILFGAMSGFWFLFSSGAIAQWWIVFIVCLIVFGLFIVINALTTHKGRWDDGDRPQRKG
jgi:hypothetical protein